MDAPRITVRFCSWCKEICIRGEKRPTDALIVYAYGDDRKAFWNGQDVIIQDGICERCRQEKFPSSSTSSKEPSHEIPAT